MENGKTDMYIPVRRIMGNHQLIIITKLLQQIETMQSIDELFLWLADMIMLRMDIQVVQFWALQNYSNGKVSCELRTTAHQNTTLPQHVVVNQPLGNTVEHLLNKQQSVVPQPVKGIFSQYLGKQLMRYNLNYWACHFMSNDTLFLPAKNTFSYGKVATPLTLEVSIFSQHTPSSRLLPTLSHILEHVLPIAKKHGLLTTMPPQTERGLQLSAIQPTGKLSVPTEFTPHRTQGLATTKQTLIGERSLIQDKNARRLYHEIDGQKNIGELASMIQLSSQEFYAALCLLLAHKYIQLSEAHRKNVSPSIPRTTDPITDPITDQTTKILYSSEDSRLYQ